MKRTLFLLQAALLAACLALAPATLLAQDGMKQSTPEKRAQMQTDYLKTQLQLDDAQTQKIGAINLKYAQQMDPVLKGNGSKLSKLRTAKKINSQKEAEYREVLSKEQFEKYQAVKEEMKDKMKEKMQERKEKGSNGLQ
jgi:methionine-rich copper-binding protein CopC